ncbi:hypothetical protein [Mucisphaera sp.]|uniref:hypothetical protein n=1 Tax=Mucisphaera sp. TaxID=2913024 RepID=UPI003D1326DB
MQSQTLRFTVLLWCVLWFAVILPGHKRGAIALPGETQDLRSVNVCPFCDLLKIPADTDTPLQPCSGGCLICHLKLGTAPPPAPIVYEPIFTQLDDLPLLTEASLIDQIDRHLPKLGRAPPTA